MPLELVEIVRTVELTAAIYRGDNRYGQQQFRVEVKRRPDGRFTPEIYERVTLAGQADGLNSRGKPVSVERPVFGWDLASGIWPLEFGRPVPSADTAEEALQIALSKLERLGRR